MHIWLPKGYHIQEANISYIKRNNDRSLTETATDNHIIENGMIGSQYQMVKRNTKPQSKVGTFVLSRYMYIGHVIPWRIHDKTAL